MGPRFGVTIIPSASERSDPIAEARRAEELGFDLVAVWDHPHGEQASFEAWTFMTWIAAHTTRIRIASDVLSLPFRLPALIAKMAETLDRLSGGRLILGLGAGYMDHEFAAYGAPVRPPAEKIEALEEALRIIRGVWTEPVFTYDGKYYRNEEARLEPKPAPHDPDLARRLPAEGPRPHRPPRRRLDPVDGLSPPCGGPGGDGPRPFGRRARRARSRTRSTTPTTSAFASAGRRPRTPTVRSPASRTRWRRVLAALLGLGFTVLNLSIAGDRDEQMRRLAEDVPPRGSSARAADQDLPEQDAVVAVPLLASGLLEPEPRVEPAALHHRDVREQPQLARGRARTPAPRRSASSGSRRRAPATPGGPPGPGRGDGRRAGPARGRRPARR